ncbi:MAG: signal peptide peptidase SppA [Planctomycetes bacterium]|nr:signal peptide peptidase SppA [Planctomycetota bacterium]
MTIIRRPVLLTVLFSLWGCNPTGSFKITALPRDLTMEEEVVTRAPGFVSDRIAVIEVSGILMNAHVPGLFSEGEHPVSFTVEKLKAAAEDRRVKAVVLRINSPGGSVTASDSLYQEVLDFKRTSGKPVIAYFQDVAASGAYYMACASDEIMAQRTSVTGSIGVIMQMMDFSRLINMVGVSADAIKSGAFKDSGSPFRTMRPDERDVFQGLVNGFYEQFIDTVQAGRPKLDRKSILKLADGRVYTAEQALENGLIDRIGTMNEAIESAKNKAGIKAANVVMYHRPLDWTPNIYATRPGGSPQAINLFNVQLPSFWTRQPRFMYIWSVEG